MGKPRDPAVIRKGDYCAIGERSSSTMMHGPMSERWTYTIGRVHKASAKGDLIKEAMVPRYGTEVRLREDEQPRWWQCYAIRGTAMQARAAELCGREFDNLEYLRAAMRGEG